MATILMGKSRDDQVQGLNKSGMSTESPNAIGYEQRYFTIHSKGLYQPALPSGNRGRSVAGLDRERERRHGLTARFPPPPLLYKPNDRSLWLF